jgi:peptide/nickel transport system substrate-binding protein
MYASFEPTTTKMVQAIADQLGKVGVTVELVGVANFSEFGTQLATGTISAFSLGWGGQTQFINVNQLWTEGVGLNPYNNDVVGLDELFEAYTTSSDEDRDATAQAVEQLIVEQALTVPIVQQQALWYSSPKLEGFRLDPTGAANSPAHWTLTK